MAYEWFEQASPWFKGLQRITAVEGSRLAFERADGTRSTGDAAMKARIHQNIVSERLNGYPLRSRRIAFSGDQPVGFAPKEVFPIIAAAIERLSNSSQAYVTHNNIVAALLEDFELRPLLDQLSERDPQQKTMYWWASNMVAWFSQGITVGRSAWDRQFERKQIDGCWAYRIRTG